MSEIGKHSNRVENSTQGALASTHVRMILDSAMDGIISIDHLQNIILFNRAAEEIFGWPANQILGRPIDVLIPSRFHGTHHQSVEQFGQGVIKSRRMGVQRTVMALHHSGAEFPIEASISQTSVDGVQIFTVILRDVTEAVRRRQQIEEQSQMLDQVSDAVIVVDSMGKITYWNQGAQNLFEWTADEAVGRDECDLLFQGDRQILTMITQEASNRGRWAGEYTMTTRSGKTVIVDHRRTVLKKETGGIKGFLCIDIDITFRKKQDRLSLRSQRLESIGTLAGGIAHDLNNVLTPILMGAQLLSSERSGTNRQGILDTMVASAHRGAGLIQQLLSFAGGIQGDRQQVSVVQLINETYGLLEHTFPKSICIQTKIDPNCHSVLGDATELSQILMNLCINARDAMNDGGTLIIEAEPICFAKNSALPHPDAHEGLYLVMKVSDTGCGMTPDVLDRIFDPFFTTKEIGKGTGLGLATVQGIVKSHGGFILVYSEPNCGSVFSIYLPAATSVETNNLPLSAKLSYERGTGHVILVVDDEAMIVQMTTTVLEGYGYRVISASNGQTALEQYAQRAGEISAVLLDMMMPGIDGLQTLEKLLGINPDVKVVACSGLGTAQRESNAVSAGAKAFLPKPYSDEQLLTALSRLLNEDSLRSH